MPYDVFISYASSDRAFAEEVNRRLLAEGFKVWFDKDRLDPGYDWHRLIEQGCENSRVLLPILTPQWKRSDWTKYETYGAEAVVPLLFEGTWAEVSTPPLERFQAEILDMNRLGGPDWTSLTADIRRVRDLPLPEKTTHITHVHYRPNPFFTGRERELIHIHEELHCSPMTMLTQGRVRAIAAMGGAGKTTLARHYVEKFWRCYSQIFWVDCRIGFESEFAHIHDILFPERTNIGLKNSDKAASALHTLTGTEPRLLILDNAEDEKSTMAWIPKTGGCHTLITSRFAGYSSAIKTIHLFLLQKTPALEFLQKRAGRKAAGPELAACEALAEKLGYLPLALEQAAAYIEQQGDDFGFADYVHLYEGATRELLDAGALGSTEYPDSVITTWKSTIAKLSPRGRAILHLCSYLANTPITIRMIIDGAGIVLDHARKLLDPTPPASGGGNEAWVRSELGHLKGYSMIQLAGHSFTMHPLLQVVEVLADSREEQGDAWAHATALLQQSAPAVSWQDDCRDRWSLANDRLWSQILLHVTNLESLPHENVGAVALVDFQLLSVHANASQKQYEPALTRCRELLDALEQDEDSKPDMCIEVREALAYLQKQSRKCDDALWNFTEVYQTNARVRGNENCSTLRARHNIAVVMHKLNRSDEAELIMKEVLEIRKRVLGEEDYDTITSIHDIGWLLSNFDKRLAEAEPLLRHALESWQRSLGLANPDTRAAAENLTFLLQKKGDFAEAEGMQRDLLHGTEEVIGTDHLDCFGLKHNLALFTFNTGKFEESEKLIKEVISGYRRYLTPDHRDMLTALQDYGTTLGQLGRYSEAEPLLREALAGYEKTQGTDTTDTLRTQKNLAGVLQAKGDLDGAELMFRQVLETRERVLVKDHPDTLDSMKELADLLEKTDRIDESRILRRRRIDVLSAKSDTPPLTLRSLALDFFKLGEFAKAEELLNRILESGFEVPGTHHHLARICLMTDRNIEAQVHIAQAWRARAEAKSYIIARLLWLRLVTRLLCDQQSTTGDDTSKTILAQLKGLLQDDAAFMEWSMELVLKHLEGKLDVDALQFLSALVADMSDRNNLSVLDQHAVWRETEPQPLE